MKRYLYLAHRWLGIGLGLFVLLWIVSGVVMLFVGYPKLTAEEHLSRLQPLSVNCCIAPGAALAASKDPRTPLSLRLTGAGGSPRYLLDYGDGPLLAVDARSGKRIEHIGAAEALASARQFADGAEVRLLDRVEEDAWTRNHALARERPLYRVQADDAEGRLLYVSSHTGLVVRDATAHERAWNLLGAWLHWLYPLREVMPKAIWSVALVYGALLAAVLVLLGMAIGLLRWRFAGRYRNGSHSPYPAGAGRVHHVGGMLVGVALLVWLVSGMLSMEPWGLFEKRSTIDAAALRKAPLNAEALDTDLAAALARLREAGIEPVELQWQVLGDQPYLLGINARGETRILPATHSEPAQERLERALLEREVRQAWPEQQHPRCASNGWNRKTSTTTPVANRASTAICRDGCRCCGCVSTIRPRPGCTSILTAAPLSNSWTSAGVPCAGCSSCCTAGIGCPCCNGRCCVTACCWRSAPACC